MRELKKALKSSLTTCNSKKLLTCVFRAFPRYLQYSSDMFISHAFFYSCQDNNNSYAKFNSENLKRNCFVFFEMQTVQGLFVCINFVFGHELFLSRCDVCFLLND